MSKQAPVNNHPCYRLLQNMPALCGVYQMYDQQHKIIYVGKARSLKQRVASYFRDNNRADKNTVLMSKVVDIQVILTETEQEALLLEANLIKEYRPRYNILLRDDKSYPYLYLDTEQSFPRLDFYRGSCKGKGRYFGPYPNAGAVREMLSWIQKLFQLRQCSNHFFAQRKRPCLQYEIKRCTAPCVGKVSEQDYALQIEQAICFLTGRRDQILGLLECKMKEASERFNYEQAALFRDQIKQLNLLQSSPTVSGGRGDADILAVAMKAGHGAVNLLMIRAGHMIGQQSFLPRTPVGATEEDILSAFIAQYYLQSERRASAPDVIIIDRLLPDQGELTDALEAFCHAGIKLAYEVRGQQARWLDMASSNVEWVLAQHLQRKEVLLDQLATLQEALQLPNTITVVECFDVSHMQGEATVASCVVCDEQGMNRKAYRRFNIKMQTIAPGDDYAALYQAIERRYSRQKKENKPLPDLLLIDGGKGQLKQAEQVFEKLQIRGVYLLAITKGEKRRPGAEKFFLSGRAGVIHLPEQSIAHHLLQRIRDEAHRFAITASRAKVGRSRLRSVLEEIPGVGGTRRQALLQYFGGLQGVKSASRNQLANVPGISVALAMQIYHHLHRQ